MKKDSHLAIGLDLGTHSAKAALMDFTQKEPLLKGVKHFLISREGRPLSEGEIVRRFKENLENWFQSAGNMNLALSSKDVIVRYIEMPKMSADELKSSLQYEADRYLPFQLSDAYFDTQIIQNTLESDPTKMWIILVAIRKKLLEERLKLLEDAGCYPTCVDVLPVSLLNVFESLGESEDQKKDVLLAEIGATSSNINIIAQGIPFLSREVNFGGDNVTRALMKEKSLTYTQADEEKMKGEIHFEGEYLRLIQPLVKAIKTSFLYFEGKSERNVEKLFLCGGASALKGFADQLSKELNMSVSLFSPLKHLKKELSSEEDKMFERNEATFVGALGLAIRGNVA